MHTYKDSVKVIFHYYYQENYNKAVIIEVCENLPCQLASLQQLYFITDNSIGNININYFFLELTNT